MKFKNTKVMNFEGALRGMRNPKNSWHLSDSKFGITSSENLEDLDKVICSWCEKSGIEPFTADYSDAEILYENWLVDNGIIDGDMETQTMQYAFIGPKDMKLATTLINAGTEHRKFLRQIFVSVDVTAPIYLYKEFDTYKIATVANSTSTMHTIASAPITLESFEIDDYMELDEDSYVITPKDIVKFCETLRQQYLVLLENGDTESAQKIWKELIRWLPEGWLQTRTWTCNYETLRTIYHQRSNHKLSEWHTFCDWIETLPYAKELICS